MSIKIKTHSIDKCYLCNTNGKIIYQNLRDHIFNAPGEWNLKQCKNPDCSLCWLDPMPLQEEIGKLYENYYTHTFSATKKSTFIEKTKHLLKVLLSLIPGTDRQKIMADCVFLEEAKPGKLLDIGCGNGSFLQQMQEKGWDVVGTDFDSKAVETANQQGLEVYVGDLSTIQFKANSFDAITLNNVIEHLYDPLQTLKECRRILRDQGQIVIVTPNRESLGHQHFKQNWRGLETPRHLFIFSQKNLETMAVEAGFSEIKTFGKMSIKDIIKPLIIEASIYIEKRNTVTDSSLINQDLSLLEKWKAISLILQERIFMFSNTKLGEMAILLAKK